MTREPYPCGMRPLRISRLSQIENSRYGRGSSPMQIKEMAEMEARARRWECEMAQEAAQARKEAKEKKRSGISSG